MAEIRPFCGVHYNKLLADDLAAVICPPYDIITPQMRQELYQQSGHNFVRLEFAQELPQDTATDNKYTRASALLEQWLKQGVLQVDDTPAIYIHDHHFSLQGKEYKRRGIIVRVRVEEWNKVTVRPHEGTLAEPKSDRLNLLWALQANTSPIMALFEDRGQQVSSLLTAKVPGQPLLSASNVDGESHNVWAVTDTEIIDKICGSLAGQPLYIADGHHRYESSLAYQRERRACSPSVSADEPFDFVMMTLIDFADPGLVILPAHRLVRGIPRATLEELPAKLSTFFTIEELPLSEPGVWQKVDDLLAEDRDRVCLALFGLAQEKLFVLRLNDFAATGQMMPYFHSELYKELDVSIVDHVILEKLLGLDRDREATSLAYCYSLTDTVNKVLAQEYQMAFLLSPVKAKAIKAIADAGDRMPRKSTYFYPKLPSGLIVHRLV